MAGHDNRYAVNYSPPGIAGDLANYGGAPPNMSTSILPTNNLGYQNTPMPGAYTDAQLQMLMSAGINPVSGAPIQPKTFSEMTGLQKMTAGLGVAQGLANAWLGYEQNRLARDNFNLQRGVMNTNLANQIRSYNTALEDRMNSRYSRDEREANQAEIDAYLERNRARNMMG